MSHKKTALVIGATGLVGSHLTQQLLRHPDLYQTVRIFVRRDLSAQYMERVNAESRRSGVSFEPVTMNFDEMHSVEDSKFVGDDVFCCLGTTIRTAGSQEAFYKVDYTYVNTFAQLCRNRGGAKQFVLVTSMNADENSFFFYPQVKGKIESAVREMDYDHVRIIRPSLLLGERQEHRCMEEMSKKVMNAMSFMIPSSYKGIEGEQVARAMIRIANSEEFENQRVTVHENAELLRY